MKDKNLRNMLGVTRIAREDGWENEVTGGALGGLKKEIIELRFSLNRLMEHLKLEEQILPGTPARTVVTKKTKKKKAEKSNHTFDSGMYLPSWF